MFGVPRVFRHAVRRSLCRTSHRKLIHVRLSNDNGSRLFKPCNNLRIVRRNEILQDLRRTRRRKTLRTDVVLDRDRNAGQRTGELSCVNFLLHFCCACSRTLFIHKKEGVNRILRRSDCRKGRFHSVRYGDLSFFDRGRKLYCCHIFDFHIESPPAILPFSEPCTGPL